MINFLFLLGLFTLGLGVGAMLSSKSFVWKDKGYSSKFVLKRGLGTAIIGAVTLWAAGLIYFLGPYNA